MSQRSTRRIVVSGAATLALAAALLPAPTASAGAPATPAPAAAGTLEWGECEDADLTDAGAECGMVRVPLNHAKPGGRTIEIAVSRIAATATGADHLGPMLSNPGGPGVSGLSEPVFLAAVLPAEVTARYDLIGFDPRGVGASGPKLACDPSFFASPMLDLVPPERTRIRGTERTRLTQSTAYVTACQKRNKAALRYLRTIDVARDLDLIRAALGAPQISYRGNSYGTYLGQVYATTFPHRLHRMLLTGVVRPDGVGSAGDIARPDIARAFERNLDAFFAWTAKYDVAYRLGADPADVRARYFADQDALRSEPVGAIGPAEWNALFAAVAYGEAAWPVLAQAWSAFTAGRTTIFDLVLAGGDAKEADRFQAAYLSVACSDGTWQRNYDRLRAESFRTAREAPFITWVFHWEVKTLCAQWPVRGRAVRVGSAQAPPFLMVNSTFDAPTPLADAIATRSAFPRSALLEVTGAPDHGSGALFGNACAEAIATRYLLTGALPERVVGAGVDARCARVPEPGFAEIALVAAAEALLPLTPILDEAQIPVPIAGPAGIATIAGTLTGILPASGPR